MLRTKSLTTYLNQTVWHRVAAIVIFAAITALTARVTIHLPFTPVPITLQTLAVLLSGLVLGSRGGALAQLTYLGLIATGLPLDANGLGAAAFLGCRGLRILFFGGCRFGNYGCLTGWAIFQRGTCTTHNKKA